MLYIFAITCVMKFHIEVCVSVGSYLMRPRLFRLDLRLLWRLQEVRIAYLLVRIGITIQLTRHSRRLWMPKVNVY